jgi:hypothetical protein
MVAVDTSAEKQGAALLVENRPLSLDTDFQHLALVELVVEAILQK